MTKWSWHTLGAGDTLSGHGVPTEKAPGDNTICMIPQFVFTYPAILSENRATRSFEISGHNTVRNTNVRGQLLRPCRLHASAQAPSPPFSGGSLALPSLAPSFNRRLPSVVNGEQILHVSRSSFGTRRGTEPSPSCRTPQCIQVILATTLCTAHGRICGLQTWFKPDPFVNRWKLQICDHKQARATSY